MNPNFFIVGAAKAGTTTLVAHLTRHPQIYFPIIKEPNYFALSNRNLRLQPGPATSAILYELLYSYTVTDEDAYSRLFAAAKIDQPRGEASVRYLYYADVAERIAEVQPDAKIIILLRHPVDRLWSHYQMMKTQYHLEPADLQEALLLESARRAAGWDYDWHYVAVGKYWAQVARYLQYFGADQVKIIFFDDFIAETRRILSEVFEFLGVDATFDSHIAIRDKAGYGLRMPWLDKLLFYPHRYRVYIDSILPGRVGRLIRRLALTRNRTPMPRLPFAVRERLLPLFAEDKACLENVLQRHLPW